MIRHLALEEVLKLHRLALQQSGGMARLRDWCRVELVLAAQPQMTFGGKDLHPTLAEKTAALGFSTAGSW